MKRVFVISTLAVCVSARARAFTTGRSPTTKNFGSTVSVASKRHLATPKYVSLLLWPCLFCWLGGENVDVGMSVDKEVNTDHQHEQP